MSANLDVLRISAGVCSCHDVIELGLCSLHATGIPIGKGDETTPLIEVPTDLNTVRLLRRVTTQQLDHDVQNAWNTQEVWGWTCLCLTVQIVDAHHDIVKVAWDIVVSMLVKEEALVLEAWPGHHALIKGDEAALQEHTSISESSDAAVKDGVPSLANITACGVSIICPRSACQRQRCR